MKLFTFSIASLAGIAAKHNRPDYVADYRALALATGRIVTDEAGNEIAFEVDEASTQNSALKEKYRTMRRAGPTPAEIEKRLEAEGYDPNRDHNAGGCNC